MQRTDDASLDEILTGQTEKHLVEVEGGFKVHRDMEEAFYSLQELAREDGFELKIVSGFRSFKDQLKIWNEKVKGIRPVLNDNSEPIDITAVGPKELLFSILRWSALPGASRHHWGSDIDVYDTKSLPEGHKLKLVPVEYSAKGPLGNFSKWLGENLGTDQFFRPYSTSRRGIHPEPWHISFAPLSEPMLRQLTKDMVRRAISNSQIELRDVILQELDIIFERYVRNIDLMD